MKIKFHMPSKEEIEEYFAQDIEKIRRILSVYNTKLCYKTIHVTWDFDHYSVCADMNPTRKYSSSWNLGNAEDLMDDISLHLKSSFGENEETGMCCNSYSIEGQIYPRWLASYKT